MILVICSGINTSKFVAVVQSGSCHLTEEIEERREKELASSKVGLISLFTIIESLTSLITA